MKRADATWGLTPKEREERRRIWRERERLLELSQEAHGRRRDDLVMEAHRLKLTLWGWTGPLRPRLP